MQFYIKNTNTSAPISEEELVKRVLNHIGDGGYTVDGTAKVMEAMSRVRNGEMVHLFKDVYAYVEEENK